jgi:hypothetical protein
MNDTLELQQAIRVDDVIPDRPISDCMHKQQTLTASPLGVQCILRDFVLGPKSNVMYTKPVGEICRKH